MKQLDKNSTVTKKQRRIATKHIKGETNVEIGKLEYPAATPKSQRQIVYQQLKKPVVRQYLEQAKLQAMKDHNIGWDRVMAVIDKGLDATRNGEDDMSIQLRSAKQASEYLELPKDTVNDETAQTTNLPSGIDEVQLIRLLKSK